MPSRESDRYKYRLLDVCQKVHTSLDSDDERLDRETLVEYREWLMFRLANWVLLDEPERDFDRAVRALVHVAVVEVGEHSELEHYP